MKKLLFLTFLFLNLQAYSQLNDFIYQYDWHLKAGFHNGEIDPSANVEVENVLLNFTNEDGDSMKTTYCMNGMGMIDGDWQSFSFEKSSFDITGMACDLPNNTDFESRYFSFFTDNINEVFEYEIGYIWIEEPYHYEIWHLYIFDINGDYVYFEDAPYILNTQEDNLTNISIYPNPTSDILTIETTKANVLSSFQLFDMNGQLIKKHNSSVPNSISLGGIIAGVYFLQITDSNGNKTMKRVVKN